MKYLSTFEVAEKWGSLPGELVSSATMTAYRSAQRAGKPLDHPGQTAEKTDRCPASKRKNISSRKLTGQKEA
ncbi:MAG: DNA-binding protein [Gallintestinimicrobium sp.]